VLVAALAVGMVLTACSGSDDGADPTPPIMEAHQLRNDRRLALSVAACPEGHVVRAEVDEGPDVVTITAHTDGSYLGDCADGVTVELAEPVGERRLVDGSTGDTVEVQPRP
jgi:hypothetical protein